MNDSWQHLFNYIMTNYDDAILYLRMKKLIKLFSISTGYNHNYIIYTFLEYIDEFGCKGIIETFLDFMEVHNDYRGID